MKNIVKKIMLLLFVMVCVAGVSTVSTKAAEASGTVKYVYVDETELQAPGTQNIAVGFTDNNLLAESAVLFYHSAVSGENYEVAASVATQGAVLFVQEYQEGQQEDEFVLDGISYVSGTEYYEDFSGMESAQLGYVVKTKESVTVASDNTQPSVSTTFYSLNEEDSLEENALSQESGITTMSDNVITVMLCAGHDATHTGARANGLEEEQLTFKVMQYCASELSKYGNVRVLMDRSSVECNYPGESVSYCLNQRIIDAADQGADVFVDLHFNMGGGSGSEVYYPNVSWSASIHEEGEALANNILDNLSSLGLTNRGAKVRDCTTGDVDPDGNLEDYYTTVNASKAHGMTGIIVEHAFMDNASDAAKLKDESFLKSLGVADAQGIAETYGLPYGTSTDEMMYRDVPEGAWYYDAVKEMYDTGLMTGLRPSAFGPAEILRRAQFATILHRMQGTPDAEFESRFTDIGPGQYYTTAVMWCSQDDVKVVEGYENGAFGPSDAITREQMVVMMYRYANYLGKDTSQRADLSAYPDGSQVSAFAKEAMEWATSVGLITGDGGKINPQGSANRAHCATIIQRFNNFIK